ncbi:unnamed protein product [Prunus armeniaca]|uniref:Uncharacterized protein n=1 Tax=Prunus armeniaca TaxID=36596 RepID=A0A6J5V2G2_PRUAR|nr:unnamed protein product [Prunus armeniaca]CAB4312030.1 unnamed protein product [Prunus armeniaca]
MLTMSRSKQQLAFDRTTPTYVIRTLLYERGNQIVLPYNLTVADFTDRISAQRNKLGKSGNKEEGTITLGAENKTTSNVLSADVNSLSYARTPPEILRIVYGTGNESLQGGFYPQGANGKIARTCVTVAGGGRGG